MNSRMQAIDAVPGNPPAPSTPLLLARGLIALSFLITVLWFFAARGFWEDDAYIHLEFARSVATGHGFSFNHHVVYGDTSPLWVWLLVAFHAVIRSTSAVSWLTTGKALTATAAAIALSGVYALSHSLYRCQPEPPTVCHPEPQAKDLRLPATKAQRHLFAATMLLVFVLDPYFGYWAFSGMEALAAVGLVCWTCVLFAPRHLSWQRAVAAALLAGLAPLLRPELAFFTLLVAFVLFLRIRNMRASLTLRIDTFVAALVLLAAPAVGWAFYAQHAFGTILPNTNAAKRAGPADSVLARLADLYLFGYPAAVLGCVLLIIWLIACTVRRRRNEKPFAALPLGGWLIFLWTAINTAFYIANHTLVQTRYIFVTAPLFTIALFALAAARRPAVYRVLVAFAIIFGAVTSLTATRLLVRNKVASVATYAHLAAYMQSLPDNAPVALYAIGEPAFLSGHPVIDTGGITRPGVLPYIHDPNDDRLNPWIHSQGARYEVIDHAPLPGAQLVWTRILPATGWYPDPRRYTATERLQLWRLP